MLTLLELLIGLAVFYLLVSVSASYVVEFIASYLNLRAKGLERFIAQSFGEGARIEQTRWASAFYQHPLILGLYTPTALTQGEETPPSYIPASTFSAALLDLLRSLGSNRPAGETIGLDDIKTLLSSGKLPPGLAAALQSSLTKGVTEVKGIQTELESWFDANMQRASGWYKRYTQVWLFGIALVISVAFNLNSFYLASQLMRDPELATALADLGQKTNPGDGTGKLESLETNMRLILANNGNDWRARKLQEKVVADNETRDLVIALIAANFFNPVYAKEAQEKLKEAGNAGGGFQAFAADPARALDPRLGELGAQYLLAKAGEEEKALKDLQAHLKARIGDVDKLRSGLLSLSAKLPEMRWLCDVVGNGKSFDWFSAILGWLATAFMASLGAPFWFELVGRLVNLRGVGTKPLLSGAGNGTR